MPLSALSLIIVKLWRRAVMASSLTERTLVLALVRLWQNQEQQSTEVRINMYSVF